MSRVMKREVAGCELPRQALSTSPGGLLHPKFDAVTSAPAPTVEDFNVLYM